MCQGKKMTKPLYWQNAYQKTATARILRMENQTNAVLDSNIFYPQGGGQPPDSGTLVRNQETFLVLNAKKNGEEIVLTLDKIGLKTGDTVECTLDWNKRYSLMRMHTSAHILAKVIFDQTGSLITGNQLGEKESRMDFNVTEFNRETAESFIEKANAV